MSSLSGRNSSEISLVTFHSFLQVFEGAFCRKSPISRGRTGQLKPGKLLYLANLSISAMKQNKTATDIIALILRGEYFFSQGGWGNYHIYWYGMCHFWGVFFGQQINFGVLTSFGLKSQVVINFGVSF